MNSQTTRVVVPMALNTRGALCVISASRAGMTGKLWASSLEISIGMSMLSKNFSTSQRLRMEVRFLSVASSMRRALRAVSNMGEVPAMAVSFGLLVLASQSRAMGETAAMMRR